MVVVMQLLLLYSNIALVVIVVDLPERTGQSRGRVGRLVITVAENGPLVLEIGGGGEVSSGSAADVLTLED